MKHLGLILFVFLANIIWSGAMYSNTKLVGNYSISDWMDKSAWNTDKFNSTIFDSSKINNFVELILSKKIKIYVFASSGCNECSESLPIFLKLVELSNLENNDFSLYGLDDYWEEPSKVYKKFDIEELPCVVFECPNDTKKYLYKTDFIDFNIIIGKLNEL